MPLPTPSLLHALRCFRDAMPHAAGVVLATPRGAPLAHDLADDEEALAAAEAGSRLMTGPGCSALVPRAAGPVLVVRMPDQTLFPETTAART